MPDPQQPRSPQLDLAGDLAVAFVNTASARAKNRQLGVGSYGELLRWGQQSGLLSTTEADRMARRAAESPSAAEATYERATAVRSALRQLFVTAVTEAPIRDEDLAVLNAALAEAMPALRLVPAEGGLDRGWAGEARALDRMLWPVLLATSELLVSEEARRVRQCAGRDCRLFFVDRTKSRRRVWCETQVCGRREKALRHYHRRVRPRRLRRR